MMSSSLVEEEKVKIGRSKSTSTLIEEMRVLQELQGQTGAKKVINSELWHACAGPLVSLPQPGSLVYYFPQGHSEQVTASTRRMADARIPSHPCLPPQMMCQVHYVALHADKETEEIYAQMTLQPVNPENDIFPIPNYGLTKSKHPNEFFCKTLTASDTSTHGGFSVPRRAAEKLFPQLDYSLQPPNQELVVRDLHDNSWTFRHIYRGQPKRHLLTTGWSVFVGAKRLTAGDSVLFIRDVKSQLMLGVRRANCQQTTLPSSVLSADSMHIGVIAAAAHAASKCTQFTVYYNPRACPSEFVVPLAKYHKATYGTQISVGMRFGMMFETEDSSKRRYMGTIIGISDSDPRRWHNSKWRNLQVEWDEHGIVERPDRVSLWEIETSDSLYAISSQPSSFKRSFHPEFIGRDSMAKRPFTGVSENICGPMLYPVGGLDSGLLLNNIFQPHNVISTFPLGSQQPTHSSIFENFRNHASQDCKLPSSAMADKLSPEIVAKSEKQNVNFSILQRHVFLENVPGQNHIQNHQENLPLTNSHLVPQIPMLPEVANEVPPPSGLKDHSQHVPDEEEIAASIGATKKEFSQADDAVEPDIASADARSQLFPNQSPTASLDGCSQQLEAGIEQLPELGSMPVFGDDLNCLVFSPTQYMDIFGDMLQPSSYQPYVQELQSPDFLSATENADPLLLCSVDNATSNSGDISTVVNLEISTFKRGQDQCLSESTMTCCSPNFSQELGNPMQKCSKNLPVPEMITPDYLKQFGVEVLSSEMRDVSAQKGSVVFRSFSCTQGSKNFSDESSNPCRGYSSIQIDPNNVSMTADPSMSGTNQESFGSILDSYFKMPVKDTVCNIRTSQDFQSQITSTSFTDYSLQEFPDSSGGASSCNIDAGKNSLLNKDLRKQVSHIRTYTKVQKQGSVGRSIDVTLFKNYNELRSAVACMFGLDGQLDDPRRSAWKLVYVDYENDVLLVGDDPWEEFTSCVKCIRILSPSEVQQMSHEGAEFISNSSRNLAGLSSLPDSS